MDLENNCILSLQDLRFSSVDYKLINKPTEVQKVQVRHKIVCFAKESFIRVEIYTNIFCENFMTLKLQTTGSFKINESSINTKVDGENLREFVIKNNTVAIMFPYIRAQVTLLTSQPGLNSIVLQPMDITQLTANVEVIEETVE